MYVNTYIHVYSCMNRGAPESMQSPLAVLLWLDSTRASPHKSEMCCTVDGTDASKSAQWLRSKKKKRQQVCARTWQLLTLTHNSHASWKVCYGVCKYSRQRGRHTLKHKHADTRTHAHSPIQAHTFAHTHAWQVSIIIANNKECCLLAGEQEKFSPSTRLHFSPTWLMLGTERCPAPHSSRHPPRRFRRTAQRTFRWLFSQKQLMLNLLKTFVSSALLLFSLCRCFYGKVLRTKATTLPDSKYGMQKKIRKNKAEEGIALKGRTGATPSPIAMHVRPMEHGVFNSDDYATFAQGKWAKDVLAPCHPWPPAASAQRDTKRCKSSWMATQSKAR